MRPTARCLSAASGKAVAEVLKRNHLTDRILIAMDVDPDTLALIKSGIIDPPCCSAHTPWATRV